jgi:uncharacterized protein YktA (UPF0223 family)
MNKKKQTERNEEIVKIDFDLFTTEEIVAIFSFYNLIERNNKHKVKPELVLNSYQNYRNIINSISLEKKYNKQFEDKTGISIYHVIKELKEKN